MTSKANDTQVGGTHYAQWGKPQHWDLVQMFGWDYFQGQITKYLMRWKVKHATPEGRLEDLKKARHFLDKYIEIEEAKWAKVDKKEPAAVIDSNRKILADMHESVRRQLAEQAAKSARSTVPPVGQHTHLDSNQFFQCEGYYGDNTQLYTCKACRTQVRATDLLDAEVQHRECGAEPTAGYVNQG